MSEYNSIEGRAESTLAALEVLLENAEHESARLMRLLANSPQPEDARAFWTLETRAMLDCLQTAGFRIEEVARFTGRSPQEIMSAGFDEQDDRPGLHAA